MGEVVRAFVAGAADDHRDLRPVHGHGRGRRARPRRRATSSTLVPYVIPGSLPYTVPVSLLFAVTVVYGRLAADNEVIAVKTAGLSAMDGPLAGALPGRRPERRPART